MKGVTIEKLWISHLLVMMVMLPCFDAFVPKTAVFERRATKMDVGPDSREPMPLAEGPSEIALMLTPATKMTGSSTNEDNKRSSAVPSSKTENRPAETAPPSMQSGIAPPATRRKTSLPKKETSDRTSSQAGGPQAFVPWILDPTSRSEDASGTVDTNTNRPEKIPAKSSEPSEPSRRPYNLQAPTDSTEQEPKSTRRPVDLAASPARNSRSPSSTASTSSSTDGPISTFLSSRVLEVKPTSSDTKTAPAKVNKADKSVLDKKKPETKTSSPPTDMATSAPRSSQSPPSSTLPISNTGASVSEILSGRVPKAKPISSDTKTAPIEVDESIGSGLEKVKGAFKRSPETAAEYEEKILGVFPGAVSNEKLVTQVVEVLSKKGFTPQNTLLATSLCCDELARRLEDDFVKVYGNNFNLGGLSGFPFAGNTGFGAMAAHIPDDGSCLIIYGPHVGIATTGQVGKVERAGIELVDNCCGSAIAASGYLQGITDGGAQITTKIKEFTDFQQGAVQQLILPHLQRLADAEDRMAELPRALYESQDLLMKDIVQAGCGGIKENGVALLGGIQINTAPSAQDYFLPLRFDYMDDKGDVLEDMLKMISK